MNRNIVASISHNEYKGVFFSNKWIRHSLNRIQCNDHRIERFESKKVSLSCFDDKIYIQNNECDRLTFGYWSEL